MKSRLLGRGASSGRVDDNEETIKKRLETFHKCSEPVMKHYETKVENIIADTDPDTIFNKCRTRVDNLLGELGLPIPA